jgi:hypothetical protein
MRQKRLQWGVMSELGAWNMHLITRAMRMKATLTVETSLLQGVLGQEVMRVELGVGKLLVRF